MTIKSKKKLKTAKTTLKKPDVEIRKRKLEDWLTLEESKKFLDSLVKEPITLSFIIRNMRECEDYTQSDLAKLLGISKSHLCDIEKRRKFVSPERAAQFAAKLGQSEKFFIQLALQDLIVRDGFPYTVNVA